MDSHTSEREKAFLEYTGILTNIQGKLEPRTAIFLSRGHCITRTINVAPSTFNLRCVVPIRRKATETEELVYIYIYP